ncbi:Transcription factor gsfR2 [Fusarium oxysporum f. sp. rapae]|uniref:Transcription factor gsfR2 n=1 Tax=Fusarium oxysporum f. sp. rapae TaxID=485398 RepID=A0A8J5TXG3_FUSOX|nr:Transcription factor gsfR2 [Fusarium oxysporum f. sp. rapae]
MGLLQRSCQACAKARRRCNLASPCCERCSTKRIPCLYANEPAPAPIAIHEKTLKSVVKSRKLKDEQNPQSLLRLLVHGVLDTRLQMFIRQVLSNDYYDGSRPPLAESDLVRLKDFRVMSKPMNNGLQIFNPLHLEIVRVFDHETLHHLSDILRSFPGQVAEHGKTSFIHSALYDPSIPPPLKEVRDVCYSYHIGGEYLASSRLYALRLTIRRLLRLSKRTASFADTLAYAQAISLAQIIRLLDCHDTNEDEIERDNEEMWALTHQLWQHAPTQLPSSLSPWKAWLFSENVRRTIMVCNILLAVYSSLRRGYTMHSLCVEALPFDVRTKLWDADSESAWEAAAWKVPGPHLATLSQFAELQRPEVGGSRFEDLLLLSFRR